MYNNRQGGTYRCRKKHFNKFHGGCLIGIGTNTNTKTSQIDEYIIDPSLHSVGDALIYLTFEEKKTNEWAELITMTKCNANFE